MANTVYLHEAFDRRSRTSTINWVTRQLAHIDCDAIVFCGVSGALVAPTVAHLTGKSIIVVRKESELCHSSMKIESSNTRCSKYVIVDDFIATGTTVRFIIEQMLKAPFSKSKCVGIITYSSKGKWDEYGESELDGIPIRSHHLGHK